MVNFFKFRLRRLGGLGGLGQVGRDKGEPSVFL